MKTINYSLLNGGEFDKYFSNGAGNLVSPREKLFFKMPKLSSLGGIFKRGKPAVKAPTPVAKPVVKAPSRVTMPGAGGRLVGPVGRGGGRGGGRVYNIGNITPTPVAKPVVKSSPIGPYRDGFKFGDYRDLRLDPSSLRNPVAKPAVKAPTPVAEPAVKAPSRVTMPGAGGRLVGPVGRGGGRVYNIGNITPTPVAKPAVKAPTPVAEPAVKAPSSSSRNVNTNTPKPENTNTPSEGNSNSGKGKGKGKEGSWWNNDYTKYALGAAGATGLGALGYGGYRLVSSD